MRLEMPHARLASQQALILGYALCTLWLALVADTNQSSRSPEGTTQSSLMQTGKFLAGLLH